MSGHLPSDGWSLAYVLKRGAVVHEFAATVVADHFDVRVHASTTATFGSGRYQLVGRLTRTDESGAEPEVYTAFFGHLDVLGDPTDEDSLSHAETMIPLLEAAIEARVQGTAAGALRRWREGTVEEEYSEDVVGLLQQLGHYYERVRQERGGRPIQTLRGRFAHPG